MNQPAIAPTSWMHNLGQRVRWAWLAFTAPQLAPVVTLESGVLLDLRSRSIVIPGDFHLHAEGRMRLTAGEHVVIRSGTQDGGCIFLNTQEDAQGNPIREPLSMPQLEHTHEH